MIDTRIELFLLLAMAFSVGAPQTPPAPKIPVPTIPQVEVDPKMPYFLVCAKACDDCARICEMCSAHCAKLVADGKKEHLATLKYCQDCAAVCDAASRITARDGPMAGLIALACADACKRCGDECEKHSNDPIMKRCAEECHACEKACREMHKQAGAGRPEK
jgi:hypothetical protein